MDGFKKLALFDFDGTITTQDTFLAFIKFSRGHFWFYLGMILLSPMLIFYKIGLLSNSIAKQMVLSFFFYKIKETKMNKWGVQFCEKILPKLLKKSALDRIKWHQENGHRVILVSASISYWVKPWCNAIGIELISSELEIKKGKITGKLSMPNCYGFEKVNRIKQYLNLEEYHYIYAYGDTSGDFKMLELAQEQYFRTFD